MQLFERFKPQNPGFISLPAFCGFTWVLARTYRMSREQIVASSELILNASALELQHSAAIRRALTHFRDSRADFADSCITVLAAEAECDRTLTFDVVASPLPGMRLLR